MRPFRLIFTFYRSFAFASWMITLCCMLVTYTNGSSAFTTLFWFKLSTLAVFFFFINSYKREEIYYYKNLGISKLV
ncbi:MAG: hypothetical protein KJ754_10360, partial [Bacteroidetes bacterium]|nr:hypothetical protein [Bacteroidota bacterium]